MQTSIETQLNEMRRGLDLRPEQIDTASVVPIFVPATFFARGNWPGPHTRLRAPEIGLTWTILLPNQTMRYVNFAISEHWESRQLDWKTLALRNLSRLTNDQPGVREIRRPNGETVAICFMFEDGLGPSRLLFRDGLASQFPAGYRVAMPEMSCGIAFSKDIGGPDMANVQKVIDHCYQHGTRRFVPGTYDADDLLPAQSE